MVHHGCRGNTAGWLSTYFLISLSVHMWFGWIVYMFYLSHARSHLIHCKHVHIDSNLFAQSKPFRNSIHPSSIPAYPLQGHRGLQPLPADTGWEVRTSHQPATGLTHIDNPVHTQIYTCRQFGLSCMSQQLEETHWGTGRTCSSTQKCLPNLELASEMSVKQMYVKETS